MSASPHGGDDTPARIGERLALLQADRVPHALHAGDGLAFPSSAEHRCFSPTSEEARGVGARVYRRSP